ncbi:MAG: YggT family protein [Clostridia bacterium]|nr:YggT family protein [Clostridia bacterium]
MKLLIYLVVTLSDTVLSAVLFAMLIRAVLSFLMIGDDNKFSVFLYAITEPFILPVRTLFEKMGWFQGTPIDVSFFITCILLEMLRLTLSCIPH